MRDRSLAICRYIRDILREDYGVISLISKDNINTLINDKEEVKFPIITITRNSINIEYTKDIAHYNTVYFGVNIYGRSYDEVIDLAIEVRHALETFQWKDEELEIYMEPIRLEGAFEGFDNGIYSQSLDFSCMMK